MSAYNKQSLSKYLDQLAAKEPVPGGGSAAAYVAAMGASLVSMVARYSISPQKPKKVNKRIRTIEQKSERLRKRLCTLVNLDAKAYLQLTQSRSKKPSIRKKALEKAQDIPREVCRLCFQALDLTPFLVKNGSPYLLSDIRVAAEFLLAAFNASLVNIEVNQ